MKKVFKTTAADRTREMDRARRLGNAGKRDNEPTLVYVIECAQHVKVGIASDIYSRLATVKSSNPLEVRLSYRSKMMPRSQARAIEVACHTYLIERHVHGEWFEVEAKIAIEFLATMTEKGLAPEDQGPVQLRLVG